LLFPSFIDSFLGSHIYSAGKLHLRARRNLRGRGGNCKHTPSRLAKKQTDDRQVCKMHMSKALFNAPWQNQGNTKKRFRHTLLTSTWKNLSVKETAIRQAGAQRRGARGAQCPWRRPTGGRRKVPTMSHVLSSIQYIYSQKTLGLNTGASKLLLSLGAV